MFCRQCGMEIEQGAQYCPYCGATVRYGDEDVRTIPVPSRGSSGRGRKVAVALAVVIVVIVAAVVLLHPGTGQDGPNDDPDEVATYENITLRGGMCSEDIQTTVKAGTATLEYKGDGTAVWLWRDACAPVFTEVDNLFGEQPYQNFGSEVLSLSEPGMYQVKLQVDGRTVHTGYVVVDGEVDRSWQWSRPVGASTATYSVDWSFQFSDYLGYHERDVVRGADDESYARFVVVDDDILSLEAALSNAYTKVHGHEPVAGSQDYADYLLSFVQVCFGYPPMIEELYDGVYAESSDGSPDTYLYGQVEYWAYPMETLYMGEGDCEDTSFLASALFSAAGYESALATPPGHMMALVVVDGYQRDFLYEFYNMGMQCWHFTTNTGQVYYFCETTYDNAVPVGYSSISMAGDLSTVRDITLVPAYSAS